MADDIGWFNIGVYNQGIMAGRTPNLDRLANEGMRFTDYYAEASCTAGRANFITGRIADPHGSDDSRTSRRDQGMPDRGADHRAPRSRPSAMPPGQFGKNHFGDLNQYLPTLHGFDEFYGYLYHLDAMEDPLPSELSRSSSATRSARATCCTPGRPMWTIRPSIRAGARSASRRSTDDGRCSVPDDGMKTRGRREVILDKAMDFIDKAKADNKPFFLWLNPTRMHIVTHLSEKYRSVRNSEERLVHSGSRHGAA